MSSQIFEELFDSKARVKILKFFFIAKRVQERGPLVKREVSRLLKIGFIQKRNKPVKR
jgi:predicted transcriptional regulator